MEKESIVYKVTSPSGKSYIGISSNSLNRRKSSHEYAARNGSKLLIHNAIRKYGDQLVWEVLETCKSFKEASSREIWYVSHFKTNTNGYNLTLGGEGNPGCSLSAEHRSKISKACSGIKRSDVQKENYSKGKMGKSFEVIDLTGNIVGTWQNLRQCSRDLNIPKPHIWRCLKGLRAKTRNLIFRYIEA